MEGVEPTYHAYKARVIAIIRHQHKKMEEIFKSDFTEGLEPSKV